MSNLCVFTKVQNKQNNKTKLSNLTCAFLDHDTTRGHSYCAKPQSLLAGCFHLSGYRLLPGETILMGG